MELDIILHQVIKVKDKQMRKILFKELKNEIHFNDEAIHSMIMESFVMIENKKCHINNGKITYFRGSTNDATPLLQALFKRQSGVELNDKECNYLLNVFIPLNNYDSLVQEIDLLAHHDYVSFTDTEIKLVKSGIVQALYTHDDGRLEEEFIKEYKQHFIYLDDMIRMIVFAKIAPTKKSFLYLPAPSDFGKSLLIAAIQESGLGTEIKNVKSFLLKADSSSISVNKLASSSCIMFDEFEYFIKELKDITFDMDIAEKYGMARKVKLGLKIMLSANMSPSLVGGVDEQILNRVMVLRNVKSGKFQHLNSVLQIGTHRARNYLARYIREFADSLLDNMRTMNDPVLYAQKEMIKYGEDLDIRHLNEVDTLDHVMTDAIAEAIDEVGESRDIVKMPDGTYFIAKPQKTIEFLLKTQLSDNKVKHFMSYYNNYIKSDNVGEYKNYYIKAIKKRRKGIIFKGGGE